MIVEFVGYPGVGKSTLAALLDDRADASNLKLLPFDDYQRLDREIGQAAIMKKGRLARWATLAPMAWRQPRLVLCVVLLTLLHGRPLLRRIRKAQGLVAHVLFTDRLQVLHPDELCVHHDGFTQRLWSMLIDSRRLRGRRLIRRMMRDYYARVRPRVIQIEVEDALAAQRVFGRTSKGRFNRDSSPERRAEFGRWLDYHRKLTRELPGDLELDRIAGDAPSEELAGRVLELLARPAGSRGAAVET